MDNETQKIFEEQLTVLPKNVVVFLSSSDWNAQLDTIASLYNLDENQADGLRREVSLILAGLVHPDELTTTLQQEAGIQGAVLEAVVVAVEQKVIAPVRGELVGFFESEVAKESTQQPTPTGVSPRQPSVTPENLPVAPEPEHLIPPIPSKIPSMVMPQKELVETPAATHPFEEKLRQTFTTSESPVSAAAAEPAPSVIPSTMEPAVARVSQVIQPAAEQTPVQQTTFVPPAPPRADPYREPIE